MSSILTSACSIMHTERKAMFEIQKKQCHSNNIINSLAITAEACLSHHNFVCPSVTRVNQSKTVQARITKSSPSAARKTLVSGTIKLSKADMYVCSRQTANSHRHTA